MFSIYILPFDLVVRRLTSRRPKTYTDLPLKGKDNSMQLTWDILGICRSGGCQANIDSVLFGLLLIKICSDLLCPWKNPLKFYILTSKNRLLFHIAELCSVATDSIADKISPRKKTFRKLISIVRAQYDISTCRISFIIILCSLITGSKVRLVNFKQYIVSRKFSHEHGSLAIIPFILVGI